MKIVLAEFAKPLRFMGTRTLTTATIDLSQADHRRLVESMTVDPATLIVTLQPGPESRLKGVQMLSAIRVALEPETPKKAAK